MQLFFGLVGFFNMFLLWPGFIILHLTGAEPFAMPDTSRVWIIILVCPILLLLPAFLPVVVVNMNQVNALSSLLSDICWAYAMLLTSPLVVTVGLSLTIPLSLVGQIFLQGQYATPLYWVGATVVFLSFVVVNHESQENGGEGAVESRGRYDAVAGDERED
jgi:solute carrier family 35 protein F5